MSSIDEVVRKLEKYIFDSGVSSGDVGSRIVDDAMGDPDFDRLVDEYPELGEIADLGGDMEFECIESADDDRLKIQALFNKLVKSRAGVAVKAGRRSTAENTTRRKYGKNNIRLKV
ncbi:MAG: hypothetical protein LBQ02_04525 [Candidatus Nomurabacteria bacterium]|jgi:hypothetical protein|nr:hypothetical protein [Candidatus Nomurabacteria bacterium]